MRVRDKAKEGQGGDVTSDPLRKMDDFHHAGLFADDTAAVMRRQRLDRVDCARNDFGDVVCGRHDHGSQVILDDNCTGTDEVKEHRECGHVLGGRAGMGEIVHQQAWLEEGVFEDLIKVNLMILYHSDVIGVLTVFSLLISSR